MTKCMKNKYRRQELLDEPGVPTLSEVRRNLGSPLAEIFFSSLDDTCQQLLGIAPPITPPEEDALWMSPSDLLVGKVILTPPMPTRRVVRALTHEGITEIGSRCLYKLENEARLDKERCMEELEANLRHMAALELERAVKLAREEEREVHDREVESMLESFRAALEQAVEDTETRLHKEMLVRVQEERSEIHALMQDQMQAAVEETEQVMSAMFHKKLIQTIDDLNNHYHEYIQLMADHFHWRLRLEAHNNAQYILQLRFHLEAQNEIDISYAVCRERQRCQAEKERIIEEFTEQIAELQKVIESKIAQIEEEQQATGRALLKCEAWEKRIRQIVREFQKFINFALKAVPGQAEFLLSLEKLLILEMQRPEVVEPEPEPEAEPEPQPEREPSVEIPETSEVEEAQAEKEPTPETSDEQFLEPEMQMGKGGEDTYSEGEEIAMEMLGDLISLTASMADSIASQTLERIIKKVVPPNTEQEEIIGGIMEGLIKSATPLGEDVVAPVIELLLKASTPMPEGEIVVTPILDDMVEKAMGPEMFDASTQAPPMEEPRVTICEETVEISYLLDGIIDSPKEQDKTEDAPENEVVVATTDLDTKPKTASGQECAWCEIKETQSLTLLKKPQAAEPSAGPQPEGSEKSTPRSSVTVPSRPDEQSFQDRGIVGAGGTEHQQQPEEFLADRVQSLLKIFRQHPSVARIFVPH